MTNYCILRTVLSPGDRACLFVEDFGGRLCHMSNSYSDLYVSRLVFDSAVMLQQRGYLPHSKARLRQL